MPFFYDWTFILILIGLAISGIASANMKSTFNKYNKYKNQKGVTGTQVAQEILRQSDIHDVSVEGISGHLTDHYDPSNKVLRLSETTANSTSVAAIGVAAHECGHAVQDAKGYFFMSLRQRIVPVVNFGSKAALPILLLGVLFGYNQTLVNIGIFLFSFTLIFQLVTLPVEFDASNRALKIIKQGEILTAEEYPMAKKTLRAAAMTYVAATAASFLSLLRIVLLFGGRDRN